VVSERQEPNDPGQATGRGSWRLRAGERDGQRGAQDVASAASSWAPVAEKWNFTFAPS